MLLTISAPLFSAVASCTLRPGDDARFYLEGIFVDASDPSAPQLVATNGHMLGRAPCVRVDTKDNVADVETPTHYSTSKTPGWLIRPFATPRDWKPLPAAAEDVLLILEPDGCTLRLDGRGQAFPQVRPRTYIDASFPDFKRVLADRDAKPAKPATEIACNPEYLNRPMVWARLPNKDTPRCHAQIKLGSEGLAPWTVTYDARALKDFELSLMPCRI